MISIMEIKKIRHFRAIVEAGGLAKAAGLLHLTPGALSKSIRQLELETGRELFRRTARKLLLTDCGRQLYHASESLVAEHTRLLKSLDEAPQSHGALLRIASFEVFTTHTLAAVVADGLAHLSLRILELPVRRISEAVADLEADLGITYAPYPQPGLEFKRIGIAKLRIFARERVFNKTKFSDLPFAIPTTVVDGSTAGLLGIDGWPYEQINRHVRYELTSLESALALARRGCCVVFIPSFVAAVHNSSFPRKQALVEVHPPKRMPNVEHTIYSVTRAEQHAVSEIDTFLARLSALIDIK
jgi:DNA-binding transcriptional LysR family regulator